MSSFIDLNISYIINNLTDIPFLTKHYMSFTKMHNHQYKD